LTDRTTPSGRLSPLHEVHVAAGASFTDFAGWQMPVRYASELEEHRAVRTAAGLFDLSHMAEIIVTGAEAGAALDFALSSLSSTLSVGQARYNLLLSADGGIVDDVIVYRTHEQRFAVVANAGNRFEAAGALAVRCSAFDVTIMDESDSIALIAVQGPASATILGALPGLETPVAVSDLKYYWSTRGDWRGHELTIARTGYTGEDGFEVYIDSAAAQQLWNELVAVGTPHGLVPAGLACRDTLRLEAGMPLYGHELGLDTLPAEAGLGRSVKLEGKGDFVGRAAIEAGKPVARTLVGLRSEGRRAGRQGYAVLDSVGTDGAVVGEITSGALSPTLGYPIAMAYVDTAVSAPGTELFIDVRGTAIAASVVPLPFYKRSQEKAQS
jgi:aminomethyltransferase